MREMYQYFTTVMLQTSETRSIILLVTLLGLLVVVSLIVAQIIRRKQDNQSMMNHGVSDVSDWFE